VAAPNEKYCLFSAFSFWLKINRGRNVRVPAIIDIAKRYSNQACKRDGFFVAFHPFLLIFKGIPAPTFYAVIMS
jgi:hypothetical protein